MFSIAFSDFLSFLLIPARFHLLIRRLFGKFFLSIYNTLVYSLLKTYLVCWYHLYVAGETNLESSKQDT